MTELEIENILKGSRDSNNGDYYISMIAPTSMLTMSVPSGIEQNGWDKTAITDDPDDGYRQKTFNEFIMSKWQTCIPELTFVRLCAMRSPVMRPHKMSIPEVTLFVNSLEPYGFTIDDLILGKRNLISVRETICNTTQTIEEACESITTIVSGLSEDIDYQMELISSLNANIDYQKETLSTLSSTSEEYLEVQSQISTLTSQMDSAIKTLEIKTAQIEPAMVAQAVALNLGDL